ncbi:MAG: hypothetical protein P8L85_08520 [Rubripirellula sp.]|nr:hypothetical protein [Rubripirellula sp.]
MNVWKRLVVASFLFSLGSQISIAAEKGNPSKHTFKYRASDRVYSVFLPSRFDSSAIYWPLVVVHGGGGRGVTNPKAIAMWRVANELELPVILITPDFNVEDKKFSQFPMLGEEAFLKAVLQQVQGKYKLHPKILLAGYSMGGQFSHRFALGNPDLVHACAALAAGTWTTPDGRLLIEDFGEVENAKEFLSSKQNAKRIPERLGGLFDSEVAQVADRPAAKDASKIPFLVMCGTLDTRFQIAQDFADSMRKSGFYIETEWPVTPHRSKGSKHNAEFAKYPQRVIEFFAGHTE